MMRSCLLALAVSALPLLIVLAQPASDDFLPRFTEEREAAALFFVKKHAPDVLPLLQKLKNDNPQRYRKEIREVFHVTELLAELQDDPRRHDLELKIWKAESKAYSLIARLSAPGDEDRKKVEAALLELARELVDLDTQVLELKAEQLEKELGEIKDDLGKRRDQADKVIKARYASLADKVKRRRKQ